MQFIRGGPDIPDEVIEALEEGRLILFCGAGLSMPVLPSFRGLVEKVYQRLHEDIGLDPAEAKAFKNRDFDRVLDLLERRVERKEVRDAVIAELTTPATAPAGRHRHSLELAEAADGACRLVTTNFDDLFERAADASGRNVAIDVAPKLPVPVPHRWSSLVHLHGRIDPLSPSAADNLILTSADFGRAYLTEGWASRFVTDLFAHFSVLFVGYSADDPIIRYLLDALAAERTAAEPEDRPRKAYALAGYRGRSSASLQTEWRNKGVDALPYQIRRGEDHSRLYKTLEEWARWKREGLTGRFRQVEQAWRYRPPATPPYDHDIQKVLWALRDPVCAQRFAAAPTAAPWEWQATLEQAGMLSLPFRPAGDRMVPLVDHGDTAKPPLDEVTLHLGRWLTRHLDKPEMLEWVLEHGGVPHPEFRNQVLQRMRLPEAATPDPRRCPSLEPTLRRAWEIFATTTEAIDRRYQVATLHAVLRPDTAEDLVRTELVAALRPVLRLKAARFYRTLRDSYAKHGIDPGPPSVRDHLDGEVLLASGPHLTELMTFIYHRRADRDQLLAALVDDLTAHLKRALDL
jgi:SIR2-like domain